jgi:hypothetical protein
MPKARRRPLPRRSKRDTVCGEQRDYACSPRSLVFAAAALSCDASPVMMRRPLAPSSQVESAARARYHAAGSAVLPTACRAIVLAYRSAVYRNQTPTTAQNASTPTASMAPASQAT